MNQLPVVLSMCCAFVLGAAGPARAIVGGAPPDSPANRVDPNTTASPWAGVGSLSVFQAGSTTLRGTYTASAIGSWYIITAAHTVYKVAPADIRFNLNFGSDLSSQITASAVFVHPDYAGFVPDPVTGVVHDDLAIIRLSVPLPAGVPVYEIQRSLVSAHSVVTLVGYGASGDGVGGVTVGGSSSVKRVGRNALDAAYRDNGGGNAFEVYAFDFDGPDATTNRIGGLTLGNDVEATLAGGDSGSPAFIPGPAGSWLLAGVNIFVGPEAPANQKFGGYGGGILLYSYAPWIDSVIASPVPEAATWLQLVAGILVVGTVAARSRANR